MRRRCPCPVPMYENNAALRDYGPEPFVINIDRATKQNNTFRTALWTGDHLQLTLMSIKPGEDIGLEIHPNIDQFLRIEQGQGLVKMGSVKDKPGFSEKSRRRIRVYYPCRYMA